MATRIRTLNFLPEVFRTTTNSQFLQGSLDQIVDQPNTKKIQGYVGSKFGYGINAKDYYVTEPNKTRTDYQLDPGVVFTKENQSTATDFISYPGILDALKVEGGLTTDNSRLFESQFYSWDSFTDLDKLINFNQYYWLPEGPPSVTVATDTIYTSEDYAVTNLPNAYDLTVSQTDLGANPTLTLLRGGTYTFDVNQTTQFWIQGEPGVTGLSPTQPNLQTRDVYGVTNNGADVGTVTFNVPYKNAQAEYEIPGNNTVDLISTTPFEQIQGALLSDIGNIDGVSSLSGLTVMFYNTGVTEPYGYLNTFYDDVQYDKDGGVSYNAETDFPGTTVYDNNFEGGFYTEVSASIYTITYTGDPTNPTIDLVPYQEIPTNQKITAQIGIEYGNKSFFRNTYGTIVLIPYLSSLLDTLYYQDSSNPNKVGVIKLIDSNATSKINVETEILGKTQYTSGNGVVFTNGLKVQFQGNIIPEKYSNGEYYVQGVGTSIELLLVSDMLAIESSAGSIYIPYDTLAFDEGNYDSGLYIPVTPDYITIARNSLDKNAWSRSNRWFHVDVINATATYNNNPSIVTTYATADNKAKRPIIEFYPNTKLFNSGVYGKAPVDFIDFKATDAFTDVAGKTEYYPDVASYSTATGTIAGISGASTLDIASTDAFLNVVNLGSGTTSSLNVNDEIKFAADIGGLIANYTYYVQSIISTTSFTVTNDINGNALTLTTDSSATTALWYPRTTTLTIDKSAVTGELLVGQYIADSAAALPNNAYISAITGTTTLTISVSWSTDIVVPATSNVSFVTTDTTVDNYSLFPGSRIIFAADTNANIRNKIYTVEFSSITGSSTPVITLTVASDGDILSNDMAAIYRGYNYKGLSFYFDGLDWIQAQTKTTVNQPPKFDIFDADNISLGNKEVYSGSSFSGTTLFGYSIGTGAVDSILGFPIKYSSISNVGDINFDVTYNLDTFNYVIGTNSITKNVNIGYVFSYTTRDVYTRQIGWQTAVSPSVQPQLFEFNYIAGDPSSFTCDIPAVSESSTNWPRVQVYVNNHQQLPSEFTVAYNATNTVITLNNAPLVDTIIQVLLISDSTSSNAYYTIPINLNNNPFNENPTSVNVGEIRGQYQSIFYNNPNMTGEIFGPNNYRDLGNLVPWGNRIIQNSASLVLPGVFLRKQNHNLANSLLFNNNQYITFKSLLAQTVNNSAYDYRYTPAEMLDDALDQITANKINSEPFFWSDMLPNKSAYIINTYNFANTLDVSIYPLNRIYDYTQANYYGVLVYLTRTTNGITSIKQLIRNIDYVVSTDSPSLTVNLDLQPGDTVVVKEYNQTYGSYVPNTPTKLGLYPATIPAIVLDADYQTPTYFVVGHDGSYTKLYGNYDPVTQQLDDYRDQVLIEFETRVYNNLKLSNTIPVQEYEVMPGFFRTTDYTYNQILEIYSESFLNWIGQNRIEYKEQFYNRNNFFTFNYRDSGNKINNESIQQGYWRGLYQYYYDTSTPNETPWEMIGYRNQPTWWTSRYGPSPYTSDNLILWGDLEAGIDWNNGNPIVIEQYKRPGLTSVIPVDAGGNLLSPFDSIIGNYNSNGFQRDWQVGDVGPAEFAFRRSSSWPFVLMRILSLTKPAEFYNLAVDVDKYKYNAEFNQYLVNDKNHLQMSDIEIYGSGTPVTSYINWIVDYEKQYGVDATAQIKTLLNNLDVRLVYRLAGFSDKQLLRFYVEKGSPNSRNASLLIPDDSYSVLLYDNQPFNRLVFSSVVVQLTKSGFKVYGNSQTNAYFTIAVPKADVNTSKITVENISVKIYNNYYNQTAEVPYGTEFYTFEQLSQFLASYGTYLESQGMKFLDAQDGVEINWNQVISEFLYWAQMGWEVGSIITVNPAANVLAIDKESTIVQPLVLRQQNFVLNQNLIPINLNELSIVREGTAFTVQPLNQGDALSYGQFNLGNIEHGVVFDNVTVFNDVIYNLITGLRQVRIYVNGSKTADWNGTVDAQGFILNQDNVIEWDSTYKYTKGSIVKYKNKYWTALTIVQPNNTFQEKEWKQTDYNEIQKGLLPNSSTNSYESTLYYDVNQANLKNDADLLSFSLIGYRPRDYLALADLTDITQVNVYQNLIKNKGTLNAASAFKGANLPQGGIDYTIYENWAIKSSEFGGVTTNNFLELQLNETNLSNNPSTVSLTDGYTSYVADQEIPLYKIYNYEKQIKNINILPTLPAETPSTLFPDSGYVNYNDVKMSSYYYSNLNSAVDQYGTLVPLQQLYVRDYVWLANYLNKWQILTPISLGTVVRARNNLNGTVTITFSDAQTLSKYQIFAIVNFNGAVDGYYIVTTVIDPYNVLINLKLDPSATTIEGLGVGFQFQSQRVSQPSDINSLPLIASEFSKNKVWVDTNSDGSWAVYRKSLNYQYNTELTKTNSITFGTAVAYTTNAGYIVGDSGLGEVYRYVLNGETNQYIVKQTISQSATFGSYISHENDIFVISETSGNVYIYQLVISTLQNQLNLIQTISAPVSTTTFGASTAFSGDQNWLYIGDPDNNVVYVYRKSQVTGDYELSNTLTVAGSVSGDKFGISVSTDYYGETVIVGAPYDDVSGTANVGAVYVFSRLIQNSEAQYTSKPDLPQDFQLSTTIATETLTATATTTGTNRITVGVNTLAVDEPVVFTGTLISSGAIRENTVYYVTAKPTATTITVSLTRGGTDVDLITDTGSMTVTGQTTPIFVTVNGTLLTDDQYAVISSKLYIYSSLNAGDIINVSTGNVVQTQSLSATDINNGELFGNAVDTTSTASEVLVGAPFKIDLSHDANQEGIVYRYTDGGAKYGTIVGTTACNIFTPRTILLNGYAVTLPAGNVISAVNVINQAKITNIQAAYDTVLAGNLVVGNTYIITSVGNTDFTLIGASSNNVGTTFVATEPGTGTGTVTTGLMIISLIDSSLSIPNNKLTLVAIDGETALTEMGVGIYTNTQSITCPHQSLHAQFGYNLKFNENNSVIISAPVGTKYAATTFDFTDDEMDNDTVFDNNTTTFIDQFVGAGAVYMYDYLSNYNESLSNCGQYVYAQSVNSNHAESGPKPQYGLALDFNDYAVVIGSPYCEPGVTNGEVVIYNNLTGETDWSVYRNSGAVVDIDKIENAQLYSRSTSNTLVNLDYLDPLQGKLLGVVRENIDYISNVDPASYNSGLTTISAPFWGADKVGMIWFNTSTTRFLNHHQDDPNYNKKWWGRVFPGSAVEVFSFISSTIVPSSYQGPGTPFDVNAYSVEYISNNQGTLTPTYFFWVKNTNIIFEKTGKTLSDNVIATYIENPQNSGISYFAPLQPNTYALYNSLEYINAVDTIFHLGFTTGQNNDIQHNEYILIQNGNPDDFLPGLPDTMPDNQPGSLYEKLLDSLSGTDITGAVVPDPLLPTLVQSGVLSRPRQGFFYNRFGALENFIKSTNAILAEYPFNEFNSSNLLYAVGETNPSTVDNPNWLGSALKFYNVHDYITNINWWAPGYSDSTKPNFSVPTYNDLTTLSVADNTIVRVEANGVGLAETYIYANSVWTRIGLVDGTIEISSILYNYADNQIGFGNNFYDTDTFDAYPSVETRDIVRAICEELPTSLNYVRNKLLILMFEYTQAETVQSQNYLPWLNKTSLIDVSHTIRELLPLEVFKSDNQDFLSGYLNEIKPYHVVIKEFLFKYTGSDVYQSTITDFDLPALYNSSSETFVTPELVYSNPDATNQYLPSDPIWISDAYYQWFANYGVSLTGEDNYFMTTTASYLALNSTTLAVDNASGFPVNGVIQIGTEKISYTNVDRAFNLLTGLSRGYGGTTISTHIPGEQVYTDLPAVILLNSGRSYTDTPKVTAYIDTSIYPAPRQIAQFKAIMSLGQVTGIEVINPGSGYAVAPSITIDPAFTVSFTDANVNVLTNTILLNYSDLQTGDLLKYVVPNGSSLISGLINNQYYYIRVLETSPGISVSLYTTYKDCILDENRVDLVTTGSGNQTFRFGAIATAITSSYPVRENAISLRFDRTTYDSQVTDWNPNSYYSSFYAGAYNYRSTGSSSSITLESVNPDIATILASAQGVAFNIVDVTNQLTLTWSSRTRSVVGTYANIGGDTNVIEIIPSAGGSPIAPYPNSLTLGATIGFYVGMPIRFVGSAIGGLTEGQTYYVKSLVNIADEATGFTVSDEISATGVPGDTVELDTATVPVSGLTAEIGQTVNQAILTLDYPGINQATQTTKANNSIKSPLTVTGQGGTAGFYTGLVLFFVGDTFGGVVENEIYYVSAIVDDENFTVSASNTPIVTKVYGTTDNTDPTHPDCVIVDSGVEFNVNDPIIFNEMQIDNVSVTDFGGIVPGQLYYVQAVPGNSYIRITDTPNGPYIPLTEVLPSSPAGVGTIGYMINQRDVLQLTDATGDMTLNVNLPVSPGQITGHQFTLYQTSSIYSGLSETATNLVSDAIIGTIGSPYGTAIDRIILSYTDLSDAYQLYENMSFRVSNNIDVLTTGTTYYIAQTQAPTIINPEPIPTIGITTINVSETSSTGNLITCDDASVLTPNMKIIFTGSSIGDILIGVTYYVKTIVSATTFTISATAGGSEVVLTTESGSMVGTGQVYIQAASAVGTTVIGLSGSSSASTFNQYIDPLNEAVFALEGILGGYSIIISEPGEGYAVGNEINVPGTLLGGTSPANDCLIEVNSIDDMGGILTAIRSGTPVGIVNDYYLQVISNNQVAVYEDPLFNVPVSGINFPYHGINSTTVTATDSGTDRLTVTLPSGYTTIADYFTVNDPVVFTGDVFGGLTVGQTYYIIDIPTSTTIKVSDTIDGTAIELDTDTGSMSVAVFGDFALLPEPFVFDQSIVKYNNKVYRCIVSNNDTEFIFGKWELLDSGNRVLNAMDRVVGYYQPTSNMPGLDLTQLFEGVTYPNSTYLGNPFAPADEYPIDTILNDQPFYPTQINLAGAAWNGLTYIAPANTDVQSMNVIRDVNDTTVWSLQRLANENINVNSISYNPVSDSYVITSSNTSTPVLISTNGVDWATSGSFTPYDSNGYADIGFDITSASIVGSSLYASTFFNGLHVVVGTTIAYSTDLYSWTESTTLINIDTILMKDVKYITTPYITGFMAVGSGITNNVTSSLVLFSDNGFVWANTTTTAWTTNQLNGVASDGNSIVTVGENGVKYYSLNGSFWYDYTNPSDPTFNAITFENGIYIAVGDNGTIQTSLDGITWIDRSNPAFTENLTDVIYNADDDEWLITGYNNTLLTSTDNGAFWSSTAIFNQEPTFYDVQGDPFTAGYGPEELVPGVVSDNLTMFVNTRPGTNWSVVEYNHVGYNVVDKQIAPTNTTETVYSFENLVYAPSQLKVFVIDMTTGLSTTLYPDNYTVDWVLQTVTLNTPLTLSENLVIEVYETGNGDQLVKSSTKANPIRFNDTTEFNEIYLNCNYSAPIYSGSGIIRPGSEPIETYATETRASDNTILVEKLDDFVLNAPITFSGTVFGGVAEDTTYYVKTISYATSRITVSDQFNVIAGIAGPTLELTDGAGLMDVIIQLGLGTTWTDPLVYHNGNMLTPGYSTTVTKTNGTRNTVVCNTTTGLVVGQRVVFSSTIFTDSGLEPYRIYYVESIYDNNEFTVSLTDGGPVLDLNTATGGATCIINDYAYGIQPNGTSAKLILPGKEDPLNIGYVIPYDSETDYISYTLFGETLPIQYGATLPQTEYFVGDGVTDTFSMTYYNDGDNPENAIVEVDGLRLTSSEYTINGSADEITFTTAPTGNIAVTTYDLTDRQYMNTQYGITDKTVAPIQSINNAITPPLAQTVVSSSVGSTSYLLTCGSTANFAVGQTIYFTGTPWGNINASGQVYYIAHIENLTDFTVSESPNTYPVFDPGVGSGSLLATVGGTPAVRITTGTRNPDTFVVNNLTTNDVVRVDGTVGSVQLNNQTFYARVINDYQFDLYSQPYSSTLGDVNYPVTDISSYVSGGYVWIDGSFIIATTPVMHTATLTNAITCGSTAGMIIDTPVVFSVPNEPVSGTDIMGGIISGQTYYIAEISTAATFKISETQGGSIKSLTSSTSVSASAVSVGTTYGIVTLGNTDWNVVAGTIGLTYYVGDIIVAVAAGTGTGTATEQSLFINVAQWEQNNVDRIYVTVNGQRVPSSNLRINASNYVSILAPVTSTDEVIITSMIPSATPNEETYLQNVNKNNEPSVYRAGPSTRTWLTVPLTYSSPTIYVNDASKLVVVSTQNEIAPAAVDNVITIGLDADKNIISDIKVYNNTTGAWIAPIYYSVVVEEVSPVLKITSQVNTDDSLTIIITQGNLIYVAGEQIKFGKIDLVSNTLTNLQRGINGTGIGQSYDEYSEVFGLLSENRLPEVDYNQTWNSNVYNTTLGDPLQISETASADFINQGGS